ncbi:MAG: nitronate monooxygenase, partial [Candidatus Binatia bacterium]|nr:nitronate monooxygenase [Candidatus Binatia bacterium]
MHYHHRLCELLGIKYPIILGGMAWAGTGELTAAVSNAGGLGLIGAGSQPSDELRRQIQKTRELTDKPFGVNIVPLGVPLPERVKLLIEEGVSIAATGFTDPTMPVVTDLRR